MLVLKIAFSLIKLCLYSILESKVNLYFIFFFHFRDENVGIHFFKVNSSSAKTRF